MNKKYAAAVLLSALLMLNSCAANTAYDSTSAVTDDKKSSGSIFAMDTYMTITAYGERVSKLRRKRSYILKIFGL